VFLDRDSSAGDMDKVTVRVDVQVGTTVILISARCAEMRFVHNNYLLSQ
jgi:hypothetical protein